MCFHGPNPQLKNSGNLPSRLPCFQGVEMERGRCQQFSTIFGVVLYPPSHSEHPKKILGRPQNFLKMGPENAHFSHFEPRKRGSEPRFRVSKCAGISRVKFIFTPMQFAYKLIKESWNTDKKKWIKMTYLQYERSKDSDWPVYSRCMTSQHTWSEHRATLQSLHPDLERG